MLQSYDADVRVCKNPCKRQAATCVSDARTLFARFHERIVLSSRKRLREQALAVTGELQWEVRLWTPSLSAEIVRAFTAHDRIMDANARRDSEPAGEALRGHRRVEVRRKMCVSQS